MNKIIKCNKSVFANFAQECKPRNIFINSNTSKYLCSGVNKSDCEIIDTDVLIVGGGVTGLALAAALKKSDFFKEKGKIVVLDNPPKLTPESFTYGFNRIPDPRVVSLTPSSVRFFRSIGLWSHLDDRLIKYVNGMQVWENKGHSYVHMSTKDMSVLDSLGSLFNQQVTHADFICAIVEINHLLNAFNKLLLGVTSVTHKLTPDNFELENTEEYAYLKLKGEKTTYRTKLLVASDGAKSIIRSKLKVATSGYEYNESGLVCTFKGNKSSDIAYQRFLHNGIFALLPLYDDLFSIVCSMPKNLNENLKSLDEETFLNVVNQILHNPSESDLFANKLDRLIPLQNNFSSPPVMSKMISKRFEFPLQLLYAAETVVKNTVLIGDAAHAVHPLAGQGLNLGITDSMILADKLVSALYVGRRLNDKRTLDSFAFDSGLNSKLMIGTIETIKTVFIPSNPIFSEIRNLGLTLTNKSSLIKSIIMSAASGEGLKRKHYAWE